MTLVFWIFLSYLVGSLPTSLLVGKYGAGVDLREKGSKNLGATNVYRVLGWKFAIPVGIVDIGKGTLPVMLFSPRAGDAVWIPLALGVAAIVGHVFSIFIRFKGGKGVATAAGVVLGLAPVPTAIAIGIWALVVWATGYVSLGSILGSVSFPVALLVLGSRDVVLLGIGAVIATFIVFTHRGNISRLFKGTESRFGKKGRVG
jgi:glycerol-3-phosphate acyltransferase PlsY